MAEQNTLREALAAGLEAAEASTVETPVTPTFDADTGKDVTAETPEAKAQRVRDEQGRFAAKEAAAVDPAPTPVVTPPAVQRPSTWKKEYWPLYDKLAGGLPLTPDEAKQLATYTNQRENEFKSGVSTYKAEADKSREIQEAIAPFLPELQRYNIQPGAWIRSLGQAHQTLALGSPQEKLQMFHRLAQEYGVNLGEAPQQGQVDPQLAWVTQELQQVRNQWNTFQTSQQQQQQQALQSEIQQFATAPGHEHYEEVREQMAGLLQSGMAQNLEDAYTKAIRLNDQLWTQQQASHAQATAQQRAQEAAAVVAKAKGAAISPKSASPSASSNAAPKGLRATLDAAFSAADGGGRV